MNQFLTGALAMASFVAGLFFLRFWRDTRDRLFAIFAVAFWILGLSRVGLALYSVAGTQPTVPNEEQTWLYLLRLLAFVLIIIAIVDKNRPKRSEGSAGDGAPIVRN